MQLLFQNSQKLWNLKLLCFQAFHILKLSCCLRKYNKNNRSPVSNYNVNSLSLVSFTEVSIFHFCLSSCCIEWHGPVCTINITSRSFFAIPSPCQSEIHKVYWSQPWDELNAEFFLFFLPSAGKFPRSQNRRQREAGVQPAAAPCTTASRLKAASLNCGRNCNKILLKISKEVNILFKK